MLVDAFDAIRSLLGDPPFALMSDLDGDKKTEEATITKTTTKNIVLADGTYSSVTSTEIIGGGSNNSSDDAMPHLRKLVSTGDILLGTVACVCLTKMALKTDKDFNKLTLGAIPSLLFFVLFFSIYSDLRLSDFFYLQIIFLFHD